MTVDVLQCPMPGPGVQRLLVWRDYASFDVKLVLLASALFFVEREWRFQLLVCLRPIGALSSELLAGWIRCSGLPELFVLLPLCSRGLARCLLLNFFEASHLLLEYFRGFCSGLL